MAESSIAEAVSVAWPARVSLLRQAVAALWSFARSRPLGALGGFICLVILVVAVSAPWIAPYSYSETNLADALEGPSPSHIFGTDELGRDLFSRVVYGARYDAIIAFGGIALATFVGTLVGVMCGYLKGSVDLVIQRFVDIAQAVPSLIFVIMVVAVLGTGIVQVIVPLGLLFGIRESRVIRGAVIALSSRPFVDAVRASGGTTLYIMWRHILPNLVPLIVVLASIQIGALVLTEATISFLGFGVPPPIPTWGQMLSGSGALYMEQNPYIALWPGLAISLLVFGFNMFGDALRDALDPRLRGLGIRMRGGAQGGR